MTQKLRDALALQDRLGTLVKKERLVLNEVLDAIIEADSKKTHVELSYASLHQWLTKHFKYSETAAWRRIDAAKMKRAVPEVEEKLESGKLDLTTVALAQYAVRAEEKRSRAKLSDSQKAAVLEKLEEKTGYEAQRILKTEFPEAKIFQKEKVRVLSESEVTLQIVMTHEEYEVFLRAKELLSHAVPSGSSGKFVAAVFKEYVDRKDPLRRKAKSGESKVADKTNKDSKVTNKTSEDSKVANETYADSKVANKTNGGPKFGKETNGESMLASKTADGPRAPDADILTEFPPDPVSRSRHIPNPIRLAVHSRDQSRCQAPVGEAGAICASRYQVEVDHIQPWALGGKHAISNLQCLCARHNRQRAEQTFGPVRRP